MLSGASSCHLHTVAGLAYELHLDNHALSAQGYICSDNACIDIVVNPTGSFPSGFGELFDDIEDMFACLYSNPYI